MLQALERYFPEEICWTVPKGGLFLWTQLPDQLPIQGICKSFFHNILVADGLAFWERSPLQI